MTEEYTEEVEIDEGTTLTIAHSTAMEAVDRASIDVQIATAKKYPRSIESFRRTATSMATLDQQTAQSMFYTLPRGGKKILGPSARLAEVVAYAWSNLRADADIIAEEDKFVVAMGTCFDLERNTAIRVRVTRRITEKNGRRYDDDMISVTKNAAVSIALRNAVFKVVPFSLVKPIYEAAMRAATGKGTILEKRARAAKEFNRHGVTVPQLFAWLGVKGENDIGEEELIQLAGLLTALDDGEITVEQAFNPRATPTADGGDLNERIRQKNRDAGLAARDDVITFVARCSPRGGDADDEQRFGIRERAARAFTDGSDERAAVFALADHSKLGRAQAEELARKLDTLLAVPA